MKRVNGRYSTLALAAVIGAGMLGASPANAHDDKMPKGKVSAATQAAHLRHEKFELMGKTFKTLNDELRKGSPDRAVVTSSTATLKTLSNQLPGWFPRGSGIQARPKSEAKAEIWTDAAGFSAAAANYQVQASKLQALAAAGDMDAVRAQVRATGGACQACHKKYRIEKK